ncbi:MAG: GNAT family N-acetyltransferase [Acidimicrobiia bacterium]|nr:GNAT family N-acetyltransferase [Acidimicrobiia bacterium]
MTYPPVFTVEKGERAQAGAVLGRAFYDDPQWSRMMPDDDVRRVRLPMMFEGAAQMTIAAKGVPQRTAGFEAVALWLAPGRDVGFRAMLGSGFASARWAFKPPRQDFRLMMRVMRQFDRKKKQLMTEPHWYLMALGVDPDHQGRGHGSTLVRHGIERADRDGRMIYLETETEQNLDFYTRLGFDVIDEMTIAELDLPFSLLVRHPRG